MNLYRWLPPDAVKIVLVFFLSFLIGLEREERKTTASSYTFGGVRTFPLIGFLGYSIALLSGAQLVPVILGFLVVGGFLVLSYWHKISHAHSAPLNVAATAILIAAASNNLMKGVYCYWFADRPTGKQGLSLLVALAVAGLMPLFWV